MLIQESFDPSCVELGFAGRVHATKDIPKYIRGVGMAAYGIENKRNSSNILKHSTRWCFQNPDRVQQFQEVSRGFKGEEGIVKLFR